MSGSKSCGARRARRFWFHALTRTILAIHAVRSIQRCWWCVRALAGVNSGAWNGSFTSRSTFSTDCGSRLATSSVVAAGCGLVGFEWSEPHPVYSCTPRAT
ncbi:MAG: hypothetical protein ACJAUC_003526 [Planctomycetota bacterium]|jgi:hypothetical protein